MTCNMFQEAWTCNLIHHHVQADPRVAFCETVDLLTRHNPQIAGKYFRRPVGVLLPGAFADIILVDYKPWTPLGDNNFYGHFLFGMSSAAVDTTICHGKVLMENRRLLHLDEEAIAARSRELAAHTWERL